MYGEYLKHVIYFIVAPIEMLFIPSLLGLDGLCDDRNFCCCVTLIAKVIRETATAK